MVVQYKKYIGIFSLIIAIVASCTSKLDNDATNLKGDCIFVATIGEETKTTLDGFKVLWSKGDEIEIFERQDYRPSYFVLLRGAETSEGVFYGSTEITSGYAKYPFNIEDTFDGGILSTSLVNTQQYKSQSFSSGTAPMVAFVESEHNIVFQNLCSVIKVSILGTCTLKSIIFQALNDSIKVSGDAIIDFTDKTPSLKMLNTASSMVTLSCSLTLSDTNFTDFYVVVPPQYYDGGFSLTINSMLGSVTKNYPYNLELKPGNIYTIPPFEMILNGGINPSASLFGHGTEASPLLISSAEDLLCLQYAMSGKKSIISASTGNTVNPSTAYYLLTNDLDLSVCCGPEHGSWIPIGPNSNRFSGHFDGGGHKITGLYINNPDSEGGLFDELGVNGYLGNMEVTGDITSNEAAILCHSNDGLIDNCISRGSVRGSGCATGIVNREYGIVANCTNYSDITSNGYVGGICSSVTADENDRVYNCTNYGTIRQEGNNKWAGGISGQSLQAIINSSDAGIQAEFYNCINYGDIYGGNCTGGIAGSCNFCITNCVNYGNIIISNSNGSAGGVCGKYYNFVPNVSTANLAIRNCINTGTISGNGTLAGICPDNSLVVSNCYWMYDNGIGIQTGVIGGTTYKISSLSPSQMKGITASPSLFDDNTDPVKALNAWSFQNSTSSSPYCGWEYNLVTGYPSLTYLDPISPNGESKFLSVNPNSLILSTISQTVECSAFSSSTVTVSGLPSWMTVNSIIKDGKHYTVKFDVSKNTSGNQRQDTICLTNSDGVAATIAVTQRYTYYSEDYSRNGNIITMQTHTQGQGIDIVFFGDGYIDKEIKDGTYKNAMKRGIEAFFSVEPYASFRNLFDVYYVELVSSSNTFSEGSETALSSYFGNGTLVGGDNDKVSEYCKTVTGKSNLDDVTAIVIVNANKYAGTCNMYHNYSGSYGLGFSISYFGLGTTTTGQTSMEAVLQHEAGGHGFGKLSDEYSYYSNGTIPSATITVFQNLQRYGWYPNVDFTSDPFKIKWTKFVQDNKYSAENIGVYEGAATYWFGAYRPTENSIMRYNVGMFNAPSREAIYLKIHKLAFGASWSYNYDDFLEYDAINRTNVSQTRSLMQVDTTIQPLHPPIVKYWGIY